MPETLRVTLDSSLGEIDRLAEAVDAFAAVHELTAVDRGDIQLVLEEVLTNIIKHGYRYTAGHSITVAVAILAEELTIDITDSAPPFNLLAAAPPDLDCPMAEKQPGGLGIHLVKRLMTGHLDYERTAGQNRLRLRKPLLH